MIVHIVLCVSSHSKRADGAGGPDPTKLNIYTLTHIRGAVQGAINISVPLQSNNAADESHRKQMKAAVHAGSSSHLFAYYSHVIVSAAAAPLTSASLNISFLPRWFYTIINFIQACFF